MSAAMGGQRTVLLIDDDEAVTDYLALRLGRRLRVVALNDPREALALAIRERPDVVVCDLDMPLMDGAAVRAALAASASTCAIPFLFLSASAGGADTLSKQAPIAQILERILALAGA
jgi:CheY-like chemotaxis protein